jgi:hypothetical protein
MRTCRLRSISVTLIGAIDGLGLEPLRMKILERWLAAGTRWCVHTTFSTPGPKPTTSYAKGRLSSSRTEIGRSTRTGI